MPKQIDHEKRREQIAEATWRVISERGMEGATVRNIAAEAGLSLGALRHYFSTQDELLAYSMKLVKERATARIREIISLDLPPREKFIKTILELVPTNREKMAEMEVWFAFTAYFRHKPGGLDAQYDGIYPGLQKLMDYAEQSGLLPANTDKELETERLYALVDGLALHAYLEPKRLDGPKVERVLIHHLSALIAEKD
ncbi:TetR family transcriptional regulator C-terminal domain-containing protein [Brevibacillus agri]|uniref:TetR family transcriptional regulator n=2 Tax=Brevibacillus agri TaxID=51101 RepID=A0A3M8B611_9BACL|nr:MULTISPECIES: TetR family transcriptional regulator C-terminal domain-containing protein [Brevibacillus]ELK42597.1 transcriptional regulator [Brevibacillus agri BAB-2500]MBG9567057.1 TetR family transcriptional regulator [Brevibacillus agri]MBY0050849.1 TetR family transcriptional regulator C-terminal domain-containing protein [Brevibacillus agri]MCG5251821.1 TetR family transcriptional regulator C-terminal domain-containing protein [Brevibacillus agri]MDN4092806.1 TetR family transcription